MRLWGGPPAATHRASLATEKAPPPPTLPLPPPPPRARAARNDPLPRLPARSVFLSVEKRRERSRRRASSDESTARAPTTLADTRTGGWAGRGEASGISAESAVPPGPGWGGRWVVGGCGRVRARG